MEIRPVDSYVRKIDIATLCIKIFSFLITSNTVGYLQQVSHFCIMTVERNKTPLIYFQKSVWSVNHLCRQQFI